MKSELEFYKQPFRKIKYGSWVYDADNNFVFQFETRFNAKGDYEDGELELQQQVLESLNSTDHKPIIGKKFFANPNDGGEIWYDEIHFITIRGWGNLTGIGAHNFDAEKAAKIQDDFCDWIIYKLTPTL